MCSTLFVIFCHSPAQSPPKAPISLTEIHLRNSVGSDSATPWTRFTSFLSRSLKAIVLQFLLDPQCDGPGTTILSLASLDLNHTGSLAEPQVCPAHIFLKKLPAGVFPSQQLSPRQPHDFPFHPASLGLDVGMSVRSFLKMLFHTAGKWVLHPPSLTMGLSLLAQEEACGRLGEKELSSAGCMTGCEI